MLAEAKALGWARQVEHCQSIAGVGPLTALAMVATYHRGTFRSADAFIASMGLDVRIRDSGQSHGRRSPHLEPCYPSLRLRGLSTTAAFVALGRKLARLGFALLRHGREGCV